MLGGQNGKTKSEVEFIDVTKFNVAGCIACDSCKRNGGKCFMKDNTNELVQKIVDADTLIFGSPVYWWGISAHNPNDLSAQTETLSLLKELGESLN
ncbi:flavodoxin family protein [Cetobacterium sp.]|uniref:flavodoxin family protein n=1 Tax=Cetobacterium sp. TaxID=2071632 RepID=UPI003F396445